MSSERLLHHKTESALQRLGEMHAKIRFDELLEYATEVCLKSPPEYTPLPKDSLNSETNLVASLGLRGLRSAIELSEGYIAIEYFDSEEEASKPEDINEFQQRVRMDLASPMIYPETWSDSLDSDIIDKVRVFGERLISEALVVLGADVYIKVDELKNAQTVDEQMAVLNWLDRRLRKMTDVSDSSESDEPDRHFYHPARLSPKFIGVYPEHTMRPTCLSVSIIAASFFEKAGLNVLHAGVNESGNEKTVSSGIFLTSMMLETYEKKYDIHFSDPAKTAINKLLGNLISTYKREDAQHAATYVQLLDGRWGQFDPNYEATLLVEEKDSNKELSKTYSLLKEFETTAPGLEITTMLPGFMDAAEILENIFDKQVPTVTAGLRDTAREVLTKLDDESAPQEIFNHCVEAFYKFSVDSPNLEIFQKIALGVDIISRYSDKQESLIQNTFYLMFERYVLWGDSLEVFLNRIKTDESYLHNRIEDIVALPFMTAIAIAKSEAEEATPWYTHHKLDVGLPATRIGFAVLSDFAAYDDDSEIPDSFWMSYWAGNVSVMEHLQQKPFSDSAYNLTYTNAAYYDIHPFTSNKNYEIIKSFLAANREESTDGRSKQG